MNLDPKEFNINVIGDKTGRSYVGKFKSKLMLSHRETIAVDRIRRDLLGADPANSGAIAGAVAGAIAELSVRLVEASSMVERFER